jgi:hypothetical protein
MYKLKTDTYGRLYDIAIQLGLLSPQEVLTEPYHMLVNTQVLTATYSVEITSVFAEVRKRTTYLAKMRSGEQQLLDVIALTADEEDLFTPYMDDIVGEVAKRMRTMSGMITPAMIYKQNVVGDGTAETPEFANTHIYFNTLRYQWQKPESMLLADNKLFEAIVTGVMARWYALVLPSELQFHETLYNINLEKLSAALNHSGPVRRVYNYF